MAPLTWREVAAPSFAGANDSMQAAAASMNSGFDVLGKAIQNFGASQRRTQAAGILANSMKYQDAGSLQAALQSGQLDLSGADADTIAAVDAHLANTLNNEQSRASIAGTQANTANTIQTGQFAAQDQSHKRQEWAIEDKSIAAQPAAINLMAGIRDKMQSGDPKLIAEGQRQLLDPKNAQLLADAKFTPEGVVNFQDSNRTAAIAGMQFQKTKEEDRQWWLNTNRTNDAEAISNRLFGETRNITEYQERAKAMGLPPEVTNKVLAFGENYKTAYQGLTEEQQIDLTLNPDAANSAAVSASNNPAPQAPAQRQAVDPNSVKGLIVQREGAGNYDTLYGHAQDKSGSPISGTQVSKMTLGSLYEFSSPRGVYGQTQKAKLGYLATPMGYYQIVGETLKNTAKEMGLPDDTVFDQRTQDAMFDHLVQKRLRSSSTLDGQIKALRQEWDGFKYVKDDVLGRAIANYSGGNPVDLSTLTRNNQQYADMRSSIDSGQSWQAPIDLSRPRIDNGDGTVSTERTFTTEMDGVYYNIPTVVNGKKVSEKEALKAYDDGENPAVGAFKDKTEAVAAAKARTEAIGQAIADEGVAGKAQADKQVAESQVAATPQQAPVTPPPENGATQVQRIIEKSLAPTNTGTNEPALVDPALARSVADTAKDTATIDQALNVNKYMMDVIRDRKDSGTDEATVIRKATDKDGPLANVGADNVKAMFDEVRKSLPDAPADLIAAAMTENVKQVDTRGKFNQKAGLPNLLFGYYDQYGSAPDDSYYVNRVDPKGVVETFNKLFEYDKNTKQYNLSKGVAQLQTQRAASMTPEKIAKIQDMNEQLSVRFTIDQSMYEKDPTPANKERVEKSRKLLQKAQATLAEIVKSGNIDVFARSAAEQK